MIESMYIVAVNLSISLGIILGIWFGVYLGIKLVDYITDGQLSKIFKGER